MASNLIRSQEEKRFFGSSPPFMTAAAALFLGLGIGACSDGGGGGDECPPTDPGCGAGDENDRPIAEWVVEPTSGESPLDVTVMDAGSTDRDGSIVSYQLDVNGDGDFDDPEDRRQGSPLNTTVTVDSDRALHYRVQDDDGAFSPVLSQFIDVDQPPQIVQAVFHMRNMTDESSFVRGEGTIRYTVGDSVLTSQDSVVVSLEAGTYEVWAEKDGFYQALGVIRDPDGDPFNVQEKRDVEDASSRIQINSNGTWYIDKIRRDDIEGLGHTWEEVRRILDSLTPLGTARFESDDRFASQPLVVWLDHEDSEVDPEQRVLDDITDFFGDGDRATLDELLNGYVRNVTFQEGGEQPSTPHYRIRFLEEVGGAGGSHSEGVDEQTNRILQASIRLEPDVSTGVMYEELSQGAGLRRDPAGGSIGRFIFDSENNFTTYGLRLGDILVGFPPGSEL